MEKRKKRMMNNVEKERKKWKSLGNFKNSNNHSLLINVCSRRVKKQKEKMMPWQSLKITMKDLKKKAYNTKKTKNN